MEDINGFSSAIKRNIAEAPKSEKRPWSFNSMGLDKFVLMGIRNKGYRLPTAIQRQTIPIIIEGRDVVAMAKTGSGKTACFLIPLLEKLQSRPRNGVLGVILSPTRELAMQTVKHARELGKYIDFNITCVIGGDSMDSQFLALHQSPDVIVATPGRFIHLCVEMDLHLSTLEYVVFDEADRLFEMGFHEQIKEILKRLPESKQTLMFSATLPKTVVEFAEAGLQHPVLTRLDVESKLPEELKLKFLHCRPYERYTALLILLKYIIPKSSQTIVFAATHHHIDFITMLLSEAGISNTFAYSSLDATARKINTIKFLKKKVSVLVVTDVAARGLDIPSVDSVINFHFPGTSKLFIHRVGRCARAGQSGTAYSIVSTEDLSHVVDLHLFLNRPFNVLNQNVFGNISQDLIDEEQSEFLKYITKSHIVNAHSLSERAYKKYLSSRPSASREYKKIINENDFALLQPLDNCRNQIGKANCELILKMKDYRPSETVFELNAHGNNLSHIIMKEKRFHVNKQIRKHGDERLNFKDERKSLKDGAQTINKQYFVPYEPTDKRTEEGFTINSFTHQARDLEFSIKDRSECNKCIPGVKRWDRLRKKMVTAQNLTTGKIRTEFGLWIPATYKTGRYQEWKQKSKCHESLFHEGRTNTNLNSNHKAKAKKMINKRIELQNINQIAKRRLRVETVFELNAHGNNLSHIIMKEKRFHVNKQIRKHGDERLNFKDERKSLKDGAQTINKQYFVPYEPTDKRTEEGFTINSFTHQARDLEFSIKDRSECNKCIPGVKRWDRLRKKMVTAQNLTTGKIRTEFGLWIPATYKTGRYQEWKQKSKCHESLFHEGRTNTNLNSNHKAKAKKMINKRIELQNINQIAKRRLRVEVAKKRENVNRSKKKTN